MRGGGGGGRGVSGGGCRPSQAESLWHSAFSSRTAPTAGASGDVSHTAQQTQRSRATGARVLSWPDSPCPLHSVHTCMDNCALPHTSALRCHLPVRISVLLPQSPAGEGALQLTRMQHSSPTGCAGHGGPRKDAGSLVELLPSGPHACMHACSRVPGWDLIPPPTPVTDDGITTMYSHHGPRYVTAGLGGCACALHSHLRHKSIK